MVINFEIRITCFYLHMPAYSFKNSSSRIVILTPINYVKNIFLR